MTHSRAYLSTILPGEGPVERWTAARKSELLGRMRRGQITRADALTRYGLTEAELASWERAFDNYGRDGLRVTHMQEYRPQGPGHAPEEPRGGWGLPLLQPQLRKPQAAHGDQARRFHRRGGPGGSRANDPMTRDQITLTVYRLIIEHQSATPHLDAIPVTDDAELVADLGFDSLDVVELHMAIEDALGAEFGDDFADEVKTVGGAIDYLVRRVGAPVAEVAAA